MALTVRANGSGPSNIISSGWFNDFYNVLTGAMTDQPVTIKYTPGSAGTVLTLIPNANSTPLVALKSDGVTTGFKVDNAGNLTVVGTSSLDNGLITTNGAGGISALASIHMGASGYIQFNNLFANRSIIGSPLFGTEAQFEMAAIGGSKDLSLLTDFNLYMTTGAFNDGTGWKFIDSTNQAHQLDISPGAISSGNGLIYRDSTNTPTANAAITWSSWRYLAILDSVGGGNPGRKVWTGSTDPGSSAQEGDIWCKG